MTDSVRLSASRISTAEKCSGFIGASMSTRCQILLILELQGSACHNIFEYLGKNRHKHHYDNILKEGSISGSRAVNKLVQIQAANQDPPVNSTEDLDMIDEFIVNGLKFDFYGDEITNPWKALSEETFDISIDSDGKQYHIYGFIDKLFLYDKGRKALIRDFKTSKKVYTGSELTDNLQNLIYCLAVKKCTQTAKSFKQSFFF